MIADYHLYKTYNFFGNA